MLSITTLLLFMVFWPQEEWASFDWTVRGWGSVHEPGTLRPVISVEALSVLKEHPCGSQITLTTSLECGLALAQKTYWWMHEYMRLRRKKYHQNPIFLLILSTSWSYSGISLLKILLMLMGHYKSFRICYNHISVLLVRIICQEEELVLGEYE